MTDTSKPADKVQVPKHVLRVFSDEGGQEKVEIQVLLPGVSSASEIAVRIEPPDTVHVRVPDRYQLHLKLAVPIAAQADTVRFKTRTAKLTMNCLVVSPEQEAVIQQADASAGADAGADTDVDADAGQDVTVSPAQADQQAAQAAQKAGVKSPGDTSAPGNQQTVPTAGLLHAATVAAQLQQQPANQVQQQQQQQQQQVASRPAGERQHDTQEIMRSIMARLTGNPEQDRQLIQHLLQSLKPTLQQLAAAPRSSTPMLSASAAGVSSTPQPV